MRTNTFIKALAFAMLLATACNKSEIANDENTDKKGFALPVTVNVTREGDDATKATYDGSTGKLSFSAGDKLFVYGSQNNAGKFAGTLDYDAVSGKFSGTMTTQYEYTGTIDNLMEAVNAFLLPAGYESYGFYSVSGSGYEATVTEDGTKAFALTKAAAVEQFSYEVAYTYSSRFALAPMNAIVSFTISGLTANKEVAVSFDTDGAGVISGKVTTNATGVATFAVGVYLDCKLENCTLTVDGNNIAMPTKTTEAGHIYNISRSAAPATDLSTINANYTASNGETLTGTLASNVKISIADGATVILNNVTITNLGDNCDWGGINCLGNATLVLEGTNEVCAGRDGDGDNNYPGIYIAPDNTLTIQGAGTLTAYSNGTNPYGAGIGGGWNIACGNIVINSGTITATGGDYAAGIGSGSGASCGKIAINGGTVSATGGHYYGAGIGSGLAASCGNITISGGTVNATGGEGAAGIGGGKGNNNSDKSSCGTITITTGVAEVTATKGSDAPNSIGAGYLGTCGTVTIGGNEGAITTSPYTYQP